MAMISVINPYHQTVFSEVKMDTENEALNKLKNAYNFFKNKDKWLSIIERQSILEKTKQILLSKKENIIKIAIKEGGKPLKDSYIEFDRAISGFDIAIRELSNLKGEIIPMELNESSKNHFGFTIKEPKGVVLSISAFNHPFNLAVHQVIPAVAAGCPVLLKPSLKTPLSPSFLIDALREAGLEDPWCQYILVENDITQKLVQSPFLGFLSFIGSAKVGWYLRSKLAPGAGCSLEHGGLAPSIIDEDVDIKAILPDICKSAFYHAGQVCISLQKIFIHESLLEYFINEFSQEIKKLKVGNPELLQTDVGPLISPTEINRIDFIVKDAEQKGAKVIVGGQKISNSLYSPTLLFNPSDDALISKEEVFGPVVAVYSFNDFESTIKKANNTDYIFHTSIFTKKIDLAFFVAKKINASAVMINECPTFRTDWMPFGGLGLAGIGISGIGYAIKEFSIDKLVIIKHNP